MNLLLSFIRRVDAKMLRVCWLVFIEYILESERVCIMLFITVLLHLFVDYMAKGHRHKLNIPRTHTKHFLLLLLCKFSRCGTGCQRRCFPTDTIISQSRVIRYLLDSRSSPKLSAGENMVKIGSAVLEINRNRQTKNNKKSVNCRKYFYKSYYYNI